jgi:hypothetical protein
MEATVSQLYRLFKSYRLGNDFTGCEDCVSTTDSTRLASIPLHELTIAHLDQYAFKAMTTWGRERHFKHFLPRLLELAFEDYLGFSFPEVLLGKLAYAKWTAWPVPEREAVRNFLDSFWLHQLHSPGDFPTDERIRTALGGLAESCDSIMRYLAGWPSERAPLPALHLAQLVSDSADEIMTAGSVALWEKPTPHSSELVTWLSSDKPLCLFDAFPDTVSRTFPLVFSQLDGIRAAASPR